ncbi:MAG: NUDIX domain-containing protein [Alphaproteobacteria bacterium]|nr:NUDIX domain-containing protein [Alphaproteobacteria bacterium]
MKEASLCIVKDEKNNRFLMIKHHRGINKGFVNFSGGKREECDADMKACAVRETKEETGISIFNPKFVGYMEFPLMDIKVYAFFATQFEGKIKEKEDEVDVFWQSAEHIPYEKMRAADADFLPEILKGKMVKRRYFYAPDGSLDKIENISD